MVKRNIESPDSLVKVNPKARTSTMFTAIYKDFQKYKLIYIMLIPVIAYYIIFHYWPMLGVVIAFKDFSPRLGIWGSKWVGFKYFEQFFSNIFFVRTVRNTLLISFYDIIFGFPVPLLLALSINEVRNRKFKRVVQTVSYLPHFISVIVVCGMIIDFFSLNGLVNNILNSLGIPSRQFMNMPEAFRPIFVGSNIWQTAGWNSIIYLAALMGINPELYEAGKVDGASKMKQIWHITIPGIFPTIVALFILRIGSVMNVGFEKIILLYNPMTYETAEVISTYVYKKGLIEMNYSYSTAVGLFNSVINCLFLVAANKISKALTENSLW